MNMNEDYISNQIAVYKNSKTLLEFQDKLKVAPINSYAHIHAGGETGADGRRTHSLIGNGKGVPQKNANGGTYMKPNSFVSTGKVYANLSDLDLFDLLSSVSSYIDCWEHAIAPALITKAKNAVAARQSSRNAA